MKKRFYFSSSAHIDTDEDTHTHTQTDDGELWNKRLFAFHWSHNSVVLLFFLNGREFCSLHHECYAVHENNPLMNGNVTKIDYLFWITFVRWRADSRNANRFSRNNNGTKCNKLHFIKIPLWKLQNRASEWDVKRLIFGFCYLIISDTNSMHNIPFANSHSW